MAWFSIGPYARTRYPNRGMSLRDRVRRVLGALSSDKGRKALQELREAAEESAISVLDEVVSALSGHPVRTQPSGREAAERPTPTSALPREPSSMEGSEYVASPPTVPQSKTVLASVETVEPLPIPEPSPSVFPVEAVEPMEEATAPEPPVVERAGPARVSSPSAPLAELVLLLRDPDWLFAYWVPPSGPEEGTIELLSADGTQTLHPVDLAAGHAFIHAPTPGQTYRANLRAHLPADVLLAASAEVFVPNPRVSVSSSTPELVTVGEGLRAESSPSAPTEAVLPWTPAVAWPAQGLSWEPPLSQGPSSVPALDFEPAPSSWVLGTLPTSPGR